MHAYKRDRQESEDFDMIINGKNAILGRLASYTAKKLLAGEEVAIFNAKGVIITGTPDKIKSKYLNLRRIGSPQHGPFFPIEPDKIVRRVIRGMLPYKTNKGRAAFKRLKVYADVPSGMSGESIAVKTIRSNFITVGEVSKTLGWKK